MLSLTSIAFLRTRKHQQRLTHPVICRDMTAVCQHTRPQTSNRRSRPRVTSRRFADELRDDVRVLSRREKRGDLAKRPVHVHPFEHGLRQTLAVFSVFFVRPTDEFLSVTEHAHRNRHSHNGSPSYHSSNGRSLQLHCGCPSACPAQAGMRFFPGGRRSREFHLKGLVLRTGVPFPKFPSAASGRQRSANNAARW